MRGPLLAILLDGCPVGKCYSDTTDLATLAGPATMLFGMLAGDPIQRRCPAGASGVGGRGDGFDDGGLRKAQEGGSDLNDVLSGHCLGDVFSVEWIAQPSRSKYSGPLSTKR